MSTESHHDEDHVFENIRREEVPLREVPNQEKSEDGRVKQSGLEPVLFIEHNEEQMNSEHLESNEQHLTIDTERVVPVHVIGQGSYLIDLLQDNAFERDPESTPVFHDFQDLWHLHNGRSHDDTVAQSFGNGLK